MSKDDDSVKIFHELCDNKGPTVILTKIKKENIIGGFNHYFGILIQILKMI